MRRPAFKNGVIGASGYRIARGNSNLFGDVKDRANDL